MKVSTDQERDMDEQASCKLSQ